jgi:hypothetical protein
LREVLHPNQRPSGERTDEELSAVILTVAGGGQTYDKLFTAVPQQAAEGMRTAVYEMSFSSLATVVAELRNPDPAGTASACHHQLRADVHAVEPEAVVFNFECCACCGSEGFALSARDKTALWEAIAFAVERGSFVMASDFSLKALIRDWRPQILGPCPFVGVSDMGGCGACFELTFSPEELQSCPSAQLNTVGQLCQHGTATSHAMSNTITYSIDAERAREAIGAGTAITVLTVASRIDE